MKIKFEGEWISVKDKLPTVEDIHILLVVQFNNGSKIIICGYFKNGNFYDANFDPIFKKVIYWSYFPKLEADDED